MFYCVRQFSVISVGSPPKNVLKKADAYFTNFLMDVNFFLNLIISKCQIFLSNCYPSLRKSIVRGKRQLLSFRKILIPKIDQPRAIERYFAGCLRSQVEILENRIWKNTGIKPYFTGFLWPQKLEPTHQN